jgi:hypothetical protein
MQAHTWATTNKGLVVAPHQQSGAVQQDGMLFVACSRWPAAACTALVSSVQVSGICMYVPGRCGCLTEPFDVVVTATWQQRRDMLFGVAVRYPVSW